MSKSKKAGPGWIDVTVPIKSGMVHWPEDVPVVVNKTKDMAKGNAVNLSTISMSLHSGTHMDAPMHFIADGVNLDELPLEATIGAVRVIEVDDPVSIKVEALFPPNEVEEFTELFWDRIQQWRAAQRG